MKLSQNETFKIELRKVEDAAKKNADKDTARSVTAEPTENYGDNRKATA